MVMWTEKTTNKFIKYKHIMTVQISRLHIDKMNQTFTSSGENSLSTVAWRKEDFPSRYIPTKSSRRLCAAL